MCFFPHNCITRIGKTLLSVKGHRRIDDMTNITLRCTKCNENSKIWVFYWWAGDHSIKNGGLGGQVV